MTNNLVRVVASLALISAFLYFTAHNTASSVIRDELLTSSTTVGIACTTGSNIEIDSTGGTANQGYETLRAAFAAVNSGTHRTEITIKVCGDTLETAAATLNRSGQSNSNYNSILIRPVGGESRTITGSIAGAGLIDLNGADNVTIDGINANGDSLTISNTHSASQTGTNTIYFKADATFNTVRNAVILSSATMTAAANGGTIYFHDSTGSSGIGNSNNTIENNKIGPTAAGFPVRAIISSGSTSANNGNSNNRIIGNEIFDYHSPSIHSTGILLRNGNSDWVISNNHFYQTAPRTTTRMHTAIKLELPNDINSGGIDISNNTIGFSNAGKSGNYAVSLTDNAAKFYPIYVESHSDKTSYIDGNVISNITVGGSGRSTGTSAPFAGILILTGDVIIGQRNGNTIGSTTVADSIAFSTSQTAEVYGIFHGNAARNKFIENNTVSGVQINGNTAVSFFGIRANNPSSWVNSIRNNTIGSQDAPIRNLSTNNSSKVIGLYIPARRAIVTGNIVTNLETAASNTSSDEETSIIGIFHDTFGVPQAGEISNNIVGSIRNTSTSNTHAIGIFTQGGANSNHLIESNKIYDISTGGTSNTSSAIGLSVDVQPVTIRNNMVAIGNNIANGIKLTGIRADILSISFYHNSVYIGGTGVVGSGASYAFYNQGTSGSRNYRNNIFMNARSNGTGTGKHYAVFYGGSSQVTLNSNYNVLLANGSGGIIGNFGNADRTTFADWQSTGLDAASFSADPKFIAHDTAIPDLHIAPNSNSIIDGSGVDVGVLRDFDGQLRSDLTPVDIGADAGDFAASSANHGVFNFAQNAYSFDESAGTISITVIRTGGADGEVNIGYSFVDINASGGSSCSLDGVDYVDSSGTLTFADGETERSLFVSICDDQEQEAAETFEAALTSASAGTIGKSNSAIIEIIDNDEASSVQFASAIFSGAESTDAVISVTRSGGTSGVVSVDWSASSSTAINGICGLPGIDFETQGGTLEFVSGETEKTFSIRLCSDSHSEDPAETIQLSLSNVNNGSIGSLDSSTLYILDAATQLVTNSTVLIPSGTTGSEYPSLLNVSGVGQTMAGMRLTLFGVTHSNPSDLNILLVSPAGKSFLVISGAGGNLPMNNAMLTFEDTAQAFLPEAGALQQGINYRPTVCSELSTLPPPAPSGKYNVPRCNENSPNTATFANAFGNSNPNGEWQLFISDGNSPFAPAGANQISGWGMQLLVPTSAKVTISGRVTSANGRGIPNAIVRLSGGNTNENMFAVTNFFGYYTFENVSAGIPAVLTVSAKQRQFSEPAKIVVPEGNLNGIDFIADN